MELRVRVNSKSTAPKTCVHHDSRSSKLRNIQELIDRCYGLFFWMMVFVFLLIVVVMAVYSIDDNCSICKSSLQYGIDVDKARLHLKLVTGFGSRTAGSVANEVNAFNYLRKVLISVTNMANSNMLNATYDEQVSSYSSFRVKPYFSSYANVRNLVVRFHDPRIKSYRSSNRAFLVSCHYDSAISSPGASDTFVNCAVMIEVAKVIASGNYSLYNDLVFLFNNAEENILIGSHAFITQHRWANDTAAFINMEGAGAAKRLMVFQSGPGNTSEILMKIYAQSFYQPFATVFGEDIFQSGFIPSDTDFRVFRDYGLIPGLDLAFVHDSYVYHTPYDVESRISSECLQQLGSSLLKFLVIVSEDERIQHINKLVRANTSNIENFYSNGSDLYIKPLVESNSIQRLVYFDIFGYKILIVSWWFWKLFNYFLLACFSVYIFNTRRFNIYNWCALSTALFLQVIIHIIGACISLSLGYILHHYGCRMTWFSNYFNLVGVYVFPLVYWYLYAHTCLFQIPNGFCLKFIQSLRFYSQKYLVFSPKLNRSVIENDFFDSALIILMGQMFVLTWFNIPSSYWFGIWSLIPFLARFFYLKVRLGSLDKICTFFSFSLLAFIVSFHAYSFILLLKFIIPIFGRSGSIVMPDIIIAFYIFYFLTPFTLLLAGPFQCTSKNTAKYIRFFLLNAFLSYTIFIHSSPYGFPYSIKLDENVSDASVSPRYQRMFIFHMNRYFRHETKTNLISESDSVIALIPLDVNGIRYLLPNAYPVSVSSLFSSSKSNLDNSILSFNGVEELTNSLKFQCNASLPYCGMATPYLLLHVFTEIYLIPTKSHSATPKPNINLLSRSKLDLLDRWNFSFSVTSGPPQINVILRIDEENIAVDSWSFQSLISSPLPCPLPSNTMQNRTGRHYCFYHLNAAAVADQGFLWKTPWTFWFVLQKLHPNLKEDVYFDVAVTGVYTDHTLDTSTSHQLEKFISHLPPWVTVAKGCSVYDYSRFKLGFA